MGALDRPFSFSQISCFLRCRKLWEYRYKQGLQKIRPSVALRMGSLVDAGLEGALIGREMISDKSCKSLAAEAVIRSFNKWASGTAVSMMLEKNDEFHEEAHQTRDDAIRISARVVEDLELDSDKYTTLRDSEGRLAVQYEVTAPLECHSPGFIGFIDWAASVNGASWLIDLKARKAFKDDEALRYDYQLCAYEYALGSTFGEFTGVAHYQTRSKPTSPPMFTKAGKLSRSKNQSCDWRTYRKVLAEQGLDEADFQDMKEGLPKFERWIWTRRSDMERRRTWNEIELIAERMVEAHHDERSQPRVLDPDKCETCGMKALCMAELRGQDTEFIRQSMYEVREDYATDANR